MFKKWFLLISVVLSGYRMSFGQNIFVYETHWRLVDSLINKKNLPQSALAEVNQIYEHAKHDKKEAQWIKAVIYKNYLSQIDDQDINKRIRLQEKEIADAPVTVGAVLRSVEAETLNQFLNNNRYLLRSRTELRSDTSADIQTWTAGRLTSKIRSLYLSSMNITAGLRMTPIEKFDPVLIKGNNRYLRPSLFDLLSWRALDYFRADQDMPVNDSLQENPVIFSEAPVFMHTVLPQKDTAFNFIISLKIYQDLLRYHAKDIHPDAWLDADISRIRFVYLNATMDDKDSLYLHALSRITSQYPTLSVIAQAYYLQAKWWAEQAEKYNPIGDPAHRFDYLKSVEFCKLAIAHPDSSDGKSNAESLMRSILGKTYNVNVEQVNIPDLPFRALITYKNVNRLYGRIIRLNGEKENLIEKNQDEADFWIKLINYTFDKGFVQSLPDTKDYQEHRVEIKIDGLPAGQYAMLTSSDSAFSDEAILGVTTFFCSSISYIRNGTDYFILNRNSGHPMPDVNVKTFELRYLKGVSQYKPLSLYKTDRNGFFKLNIGNSSQKLEFYYGKDYLSTMQYPVYYRANRDDEKTTETQYELNNRMVSFFTDRAIYRPGQIVYFKALLLTRDFQSRKYKIVSNQDVKFYLNDVNDEVIDSVFLKTNDYGSVNASFKLPVNLLNGDFSLLDSLTGSSFSFSVEEYKRPSFYIQYDSVKNTYRIGDTISFSGSALAYAGNSINGAKLVYRVYRQTRFPYPWLFRFAPSGPDKEITHGEATTNADGKFTIQFISLPDKTIGNSAKAVYSYRVETTVTDLNGESHYATNTLSVSNQSFEIVSSLPDKMTLSMDSLYQIPVTTNNISGVFVKEKLTVIFYPLIGPGRFIRNRYWAQPDVYVMTEQNYAELFPTDEYRNEASIETWKPGEKVFEKTDSTRENGSFFLGAKWLSSITAGWYLIEFKAKDKNGDDIISKKYVEITGGGKSSGVLSYNLMPEETIITEPGKNIVVHAGSDAQDLFLIRIRNSNADTINKYSFFYNEKGIRNSIIPVTEADRGGFVLNDVFIKNNRWYTSEHQVQVPWSNKELNISYLSWKDKTRPGSREQWKIKITGNRKDLLAAEVLTSMFDASLEQFTSQTWSLPAIYPEDEMRNTWESGENFTELPARLRSRFGNNEASQPEYDALLSFFGPRNIHLLGLSRPAPMPMKNDFLNDVVVTSREVETSRKEMGYSVKKEIAPEKKPSATAFNEVQIRKNFNETAFFMPDLKTDAEGNVEINFTVPDALTKWKWMIFASTKDLSFGYSEKTLITQKQLMLQTNMPRFFREGDTMMLPVKIANLTPGSMKGTVKLEWINSNTDQPENVSLGNLKSTQSFDISGLQSGVIYFPAIVPSPFTQPLLYRIIAESGGLSDGEENIIPVLSNRLMVTETLPLNMNEKKDKHFVFEKLIKSKTGGSLVNQDLTVEFTANPDWYVVQALPSLMEFPYECAEQTFNRFYANAMGSYLVKSTPALQAVFKRWKNADLSALQSNLQKNEDLKSVLLNETPWVMQSQSETQQKKNISLLFDSMQLVQSLHSALNKLQQMQSEDGGFAWFKGGLSDRYITQYILSGIGHLIKLNALPDDFMPALNKIALSGFSFLDKEIKTDYEKRDKTGNVQYLRAIQIQYLYMRSFFPEFPISGSLFPVINYYRNLSIQKWTDQPVYMQGMIALVLKRSGDIKTAKDILTSLKQNATLSEEVGMYWKSVRGGYYWQEAPVETQSLLIEAFQELQANQNTINQMKYWLLQQKHTNQWASTKATSDACYALLLNGSAWLSSGQTSTIQLGNYLIEGSNKSEAGTGYFKERIPGDLVKSDMGNISVHMDSVSNYDKLTALRKQPSVVNPAWGAVYWQYFDDLSKISSAQTQLSVTKNLFIKMNTDKGPSLESVSDTMILRPGDQLIMRIVVHSDRDMEYVHLKDMRAACLEPVDVLSGYHWQEGLGYYQTTKDASTSFFFDHLPKGTFVFEYPLSVTTAGNYSNGITSLECMYAPEFSAHTEGIRIHVEPK